MIVGTHNSHSFFVAFYAKKEHIAVESCGFNSGEYLFIIEQEKAASEVQKATPEDAKVLWEWKKVLILVLKGTCEVET